MKFSLSPFCPHLMFALFIFCVIFHDICLQFIPNKINRNHRNSIKNSQKCTNFKMANFLWAGSLKTMLINFQNNDSHVTSEFFQESNQLSPDHEGLRIFFSGELRENQLPAITSPFEVSTILSQFNIKICLEFILIKFYKLSRMSSKETKNAKISKHPASCLADLTLASVKYV